MKNRLKRYIAILCAACMFLSCSPFVVIAEDVEDAAMVSETAVEALGAAGEETADTAPDQAEEEDPAPIQEEALPEAEEAVEEVTSEEPAEEAAAEEATEAAVEEATVEEVTSEEPAEEAAAEEVLAEEAPAEAVAAATEAPGFQPDAEITVGGRAEGRIRQAGGAFTVRLKAFQGGNVTITATGETPVVLYVLKEGSNAPAKAYAWDSEKNALEAIVSVYPADYLLVFTARSEDATGNFAVQTAAYVEPAPTDIPPAEEDNIIEETDTIVVVSDEMTIAEATEAPAVEAVEEIEAEPAEEAEEAVEEIEAEPAEEAEEVAEEIEAEPAEEAEEAAEEIEAEPAEEAEEAAEEIEAEPAEEAEEAAEEIEAEPAEEAEETAAPVLPEDASVSFAVTWDDEEPTFGSIAHFKATLVGYDDFNCSLQWQCSQDDENWENIEGATEDWMDVAITEENCTLYWRIVVYITLAQEG